MANYLSFPLLTGECRKWRCYPKKRFLRDMIDEHCIQVLDRMRLHWVERRKRDTGIWGVHVGYPVYLELQLIVIFFCNDESSHETNIPPPFPFHSVFFSSFALHNVTGILLLFFLPFYFSAMPDDDASRVGYRIYRFACDLCHRQFCRRKNMISDFFLSLSYPPHL